MKYIIPILIILTMLPLATGFEISSAAWSDEEWESRCGSLSNTELTITPDDERFEDFIFWVWNNKLDEHQVEQIGGTEWEGSTEGVYFHFAPGSHWESHWLATFEQATDHLCFEHEWTTHTFPEFFGEVENEIICDVLTFDESPTWSDFMKHVGGTESEHYRYIFHQEEEIDLKNKRIKMTAGNGVKFEYTYERYLLELQEVLTDCKAFQFFDMYDRYGKGFASTFGWSKVNQEKITSTTIIVMGLILIGAFANKKRRK